MTDSAAELAILQAVRLKGRVGRADLPDADSLIDSGLLTDGATVRLTADGRARLGELLAAERAAVDPAAANRVYDGFGAINVDFKSVLSQWQADKAGPRAQDAAVAVLARIGELHRAVVPVIEAAAELVPRLDGYAGRLDAARRLAEAGDMGWLTRPLVDSYHTVWFELHEELIGLSGRTRADEAESG
ncbi:MAG: MarR family transcriptional regulator [Mycobacterium sp.]